jgi:iron-sulfur cluster assembly protein
LITITETGAKRVKEFIQARRDDVFGIRVGITTTGCSGYAYMLEFVNTTNSDDQVFESNDISIVVDTKSLTYIDGTELDYTKEGLNEGFQFNNPNVSATCGCGESFTI